MDLDWWEAAACREGREPARPPRPGELSGLQLHAARGLCTRCSVVTACVRTVAGSAG